jgi:hypothetical protein
MLAPIPSTPPPQLDAHTDPFHTTPSAPAPTIKLSPSQLWEYIPLAHRRNLAKEEHDFLDSKDKGA